MTSPTRGRRRRTLSEEEQRLWDKIAESIAPLARERRAALVTEVEAPAPVAMASVPPPVVAPPRPSDPAPKRDRQTVRPVGPSPSKRALAGWAKMIHVKHAPRLDGLAPAVPAPPTLAPIDDRTKRRLVRGSVPIDERIDLHGLTQEAAHSALRHFLVAARSRGARIVLVITGKGKSGSALEVHDRGVLRRAVPHWLGDPTLRPLVVGFEEAHLAHGGAGAIYVRLRRFDRGERS